VDDRIQALKLIQARHEARLLSVPGIRGVGIGRNEAGDGFALMVFCEKMTDRLLKLLPTEIEGTRVRLIETGNFVAH